MEQAKKKVEPATVSLSRHEISILWKQVTDAAKRKKEALRRMQDRKRESKAGGSVAYKGSESVRVMEIVELDELANKLLVIFSLWQKAIPVTLTFNSNV